MTTCPRIVLIVDDDNAIRDTLADFLGEEGYQVVTAADGQDALTKLRQLSGSKPCVILLDLMMPIMSGAQFYSEQQRDPALAEIPVVVISADGNVQQKARLFGGEYLAKPIRIETVLGAVERHCA
ncbi:MAG TPA: response regulator [Polyangia bacterium]|nr:response regulator [Polyangia bacterium]